jgi:hypothetical protein
LKGGWLIFFGGAYTYGLARRVASFFISSGSNIDFESRPERSFDCLFTEISHGFGARTIDAFLHHFNHQKIDTIVTKNHTSEITALLAQTTQNAKSDKNGVLRITMIEDSSLLLANGVLHELLQLQVCLEQLEHCRNSLCTKSPPHQCR